MNARHDNADGPEDIDAAFAEIVAEIERDEPLPRWPHAGSETDDSSVPEPPSSAPAEDVTTSGSDGPRDWSAPEGTSEIDEGHFEPPEPPPLSPPKPGTVGGILLVVLGIVLLFAPGLIGWSSTTTLPLGLISISAGIVWLLLRMRPSSRDSGWDDGAQV
ncbi:hypothetical protein FHX42_002994 [Saccharopolyspora lacisalsi]|uniref:DUF308 domain-containing protein n=1 Tax=Halosaccharopolyspora lacisalsi TaxID=1000566 RepID=A0A839E3X6_9PSEU|nr:DUF308 domain-containing protein [Halosaccharopolyspora lacisalsi]MBA8825628.1 hypothetical protein [Halosaccharopolyspora lacisalsi]